MAYTTERAVAVAKQLDKFTTSFAHQLVGQFANLAFWLDEVERALAMLDEYPQRFARLRDAQRDWVVAHGTLVGEFCAHCGGACELAPGKQSPVAPKRIDSRELEDARHALKASVYRFLLRCYRARLHDEDALRAACERLDISVDPTELD